MTWYILQLEKNHNFKNWTELTNLIVDRSRFWFELINLIKKIVRFELNRFNQWFNRRIRRFLANCPTQPFFSCQNPYLKPPLLVGNPTPPHPPSFPFWQPPLLLSFPIFLFFTLSHYFLFFIYLLFFTLWFLKFIILI